MQQLLGHLRSILAVSANIHHILVRLADPDQVRSIMRRQAMVPVWLGLAMMVPAFLLAGCATVVASVWVDGDDASPVIWAYLCLSVGIFAYRSARSWQAKSTWFTPGKGTSIGVQ